jgi:hypothetical protein
LPEAYFGKLRCHAFSFHRCVGVGLSLSWRDVSDRLEEAAIVEPVDPFQRRVFDGLEAAPGAAAMDDFCFEKSVDGFGQGVVIAVADAAHRRFDAGIGQSLGVANGQILGTAVAMINMTHSLRRSSVMDGLFHGIQHETSLR